MLIQVDHLTRYAYSAPVRLDPQVVRLTPRTDAHQVLRRFDLRLLPSSATTTVGQDAEGNLVTNVWVAEPVSLFELASHCVVETRAPAPVPDGAPAAALRFPLHHPADTPVQVLGYRHPAPSDPVVNRFAAEIADGARGEVLPFLGLLAARIHKTHTYQLRSEGLPHPAAVTLARREGACRDFAVLFIDTCRALGLAARFVSGYRLREQDGVGRELHAWAEAYVPGLGWRGYDPTIGRALQDQHVAVAAGSPATAAPVTGSFWGSGVTSQLVATVEARRVLPEVQGAA